MTKEIFRLVRSATSSDCARVAKKAGTFLQEEQGATMVEYGLMVALIAIVCIVAVATIGNNLNLVFSDIASSI